MLDNFPHIKTFWIMNTIQISQTALWYGADDIDGTIHEYEITYPEGHLGEKKQVITRHKLIRLTEEAGRTPVERDSLYNEVPSAPEREKAVIWLAVSKG
jgi:aminodeoxyfutalosine synthase